LDSGATVAYPPEILKEKKIDSIIVMTVEVELVRKYINSLQGRPDTVSITSLPVTKIHHVIYTFSST